MSILLAVLSAVAYGVSDFVGGIVSRRVNVWATSVVSQTASLTGIVLVALAHSGSPTGADLAWGAAAGIGSGTGTVFLYRGFAGGRMSVVAPVSAVGAAIVPALVGVLGGERPSLLAVGGVLAAFPGIWLVAREPADPLHPSASAQGQVAAGVRDGVLAGLGFGALFACLGQVPDGAGLWPLTLTQGVAVLAIVAMALVARADWVPRTPAAGWGAVAGLLASAAAWAFLEATQQGYLTIAGVLAALYPAATVVLAAAVLREHVRASQGVGLALCGVAVALVAAG